MLLSKHPDWPWAPMRPLSDRRLLSRLKVLSCLPSENPHMRSKVVLVVIVIAGGPTIVLTTVAVFRSVAAGPAKQILIVLFCGCLQVGCRSWRADNLGSPYFRFEPGVG